MASQILAGNPSRIADLEIDFLNIHMCATKAATALHFCLNEGQDDLYKLWSFSSKLRLAPNEGVIESENDLDWKEP